MSTGKRGNFGNVGNVESATCRLHYPAEGSNPPSPLSFESSGGDSFQQILDVFSIVEFRICVGKSVPSVNILLNDHHPRMVAYPDVG
jgi:hypothetical protein